MRTLALLTCCLCLLAAPVSAQTIVPIGSHAAYLHIDTVDLADPAVVVDLGALGLLPGYVIRIAPVGDWHAGPGGDTQTNVLGVFSSNATLLAGSAPHRVPGAIMTDTTSYTPGTWPSNEPTDIPEDFLISAPFKTIRIPAGATKLFLSPADIYYRDNSDPDGDFAVRITLISTASVAPTAARLQLSASPNPSRLASTIHFGLASAARVRLTLHDVTGRLVRALVDEALPAGEHHVVWDGRDGSGARVAPGSYFVRAEWEGRSEGLTLTVVR